jgi:outer membrane receptor protein involved in Fe transport
MFEHLRFSSVSLLIVAFCALTAFGQATTTGAIGGVVTNPNKERVTGAAVSVKNIGTNKEDTGTTDGEGRFKIPNLQPGTYTVTISATGFATYTRENVIVEVGRETTLDGGLSVQGVTSTVEVTAEAPVINTTQQDFSSNMNQTSINELPINGQRWSNFALLTPGTVPDGNFGLISFRGISGLLNNNTVDGGDNNQAFFSEERGRTRINYVISQRAIREFQVNTSNYSAEYGRAAGGVTNAVTKSGTNQFHGDVFFYDRDNTLGARNPLSFISSFDPASGVTRSGFKAVDRRYTFGGDIGGPIKKDKAFFFFNYDEVRRNFPGLAIFVNPAYLTKVDKTQLMSKGLTDTQINSVLSFLNSETGPNVRHGNQRIFMPKVDWNLNSKNTLSGTYTHFRWASPNGIQTQPTNTNGRATFGDDFVNDDSVNLRLSSNLSPTLINEVRYQWSRDFEFEFSTTPLPGEPLTAPAYPGVTTAGTRPPDVDLTSGGGIEFGVQVFLERPDFPNEKRNQFFDMITLTRGTHTLKFGFDYSHVQDLANNLRFYAGSYAYDNLNDFIIDYVNSLSPLSASCFSDTSRKAGKCYNPNYSQSVGNTAFRFNTNYYNFFFQDDWRVNPRLTLNLGLRWEYQQLPKPFLANPAVPQTGVMPSDKGNFGPRIGFAWDVTGDAKNSLRGGYGIYYGAQETSTIYNALINTAMPGGQFPLSGSPFTSGPVFPQPLVTDITNIAGVSSPPAIQFFQSDFKLPQIHQADLSYEREIARNTVASATLLLSYGRHLPTFVDTNLPPPPRLFTYNISGGPFDGQNWVVPWFYGPTNSATCTLGGNTFTARSSRPNPCFGAMTEIRSIVWSKYIAGVLQLNRRLTKGLQFQVNYTRSRSTDANQTSTTFTTTNVPFNAFDPVQGEEGRSFLDITNKFVASAVWQPESKNMFLKDWTLSPILSYYTGVPLFNSAVVSGTIPRPGVAQDPSCWPGTVTTNQCSIPAFGVNGSGGASRLTLAPRNFYRLPSIFNVDMRVSRRFRFTESMALEFLIEAFNVFNRTQVTGESNTFYSFSPTQGSRTALASATLKFSPNFQTITAAGGTLFRERQVQWAVRFQF